MKRKVVAHIIEEVGYTSLLYNTQEKIDRMAVLLR